MCEFGPDSIPPGLASAEFGTATSFAPELWRVRLAGDALNDWIREVPVPVFGWWLMLSNLLQTL